MRISDWSSDLCSSYLEMMMMVEHGALEPDKINRDKMKMDMGGGKTMEHNDPNSVLLEPGETAEIVWTLTKATALEFACNVPGHRSESRHVGNACVCTHRDRWAPFTYKKKQTES